MKTSILILPDRQNTAFKPINRYTQHALFFLLLLFAAQTVYADVLRMRNGDQITGKLIKQQDGIIEFKTPYAGILKINWGDVSEVTTDKPVKLMLENREVISTSAIKNTADTTVIEASDGAETRTVKNTSVTHINPAAWQTGDGYKTSGKVNVAIEYDRGNNDSDEIDIDAEVTMRRINDRIRLFAEIEQDKAAGVTTKDKWLLTGKYDYFKTERQYYFGSLSLESDEFSDLNLRSGLGAGIGHIFHNSKKLNLSGELGGTWVHEEYDSTENNDYIALGWAVDFDKYVFTDFTQLYHRQSGTMSVEDTEDIVIKSWTGLRFLLPHGFLASLEANIEFDNTPTPGLDRVDNTYNIKLGYGW